MRRAIGLILLAMAVAAPPAAAQDKAPHTGRAAAEQLCAECHAVRWGQLRSPYSNAPTFRTIAAVPGMTAAALHVALRTSHRSMPNLMLKSEELDDIVAYILSLKRRRE